jgi:hypothetical protein
LSLLPSKPQTRAELRPNINGPHQLWIMDPHGYIINKHSGCGKELGE